MKKCLMWWFPFLAVVVLGGCFAFEDEAPCVQKGSVCTRTRCGGVASEKDLLRGLLGRGSADSQKKRQQK